MNLAFLDTIDAIARELTPIWNSKESKNEVALKSLEVVKKYSPEKAFNEKELYSYLLKNNKLKSEYLPGRFSDFNLTLFRSDKFRVDLYCWSKMQTGIHSHPFYGCFYLLNGQTTQKRFAFSQHSADKEVALGKLSFEGVDQLDVGQGQAILIDEELIHNTSYRVNPTISLVVRSITDDSIINYNYRYPNLRFKKDPLTIDEEKLLELYNYMFYSVGNNENSLKEIINKFTLAKKIFIFFDRSSVLKLMKKESGESFLKKIDESILDFDLEKIWIQHDQFMRKTEFVLSQP